MTFRSVLPLAAAALAAAASPALAQPPAPVRPAVVVTRDASIAFANHGGVDDWRAVGDREIWFKDNHRRWYRAVLFSPAFDLPYAEAIGIDARPSGTLDRFGGIYVRGRHYNFTSFEQMSGPPPSKLKVANRH